jgi:hypothetical protein
MNTPITRDKSIPLTALCLGVAGLIPFVGSAALIVWAPDFLGLGSRLLHMVLVTYAALIASFLGGVRWGNALRYPEHQGREFMIAIMPTLVAWLALATPQPYDGMMLIGIFLALGVSDIGLVLAGGAPHWYGRLRVGLTVLVVLSLLGALFGH